MSEINHDEPAAQAAEALAAWKAFERRLLTLLEAMQVEGDHLVIEVGDSREVPTVEFGVRSGELWARVGEDEYTENHATGREPLVHRAIMLLCNIAAVPHPDLLTHRAAGPINQMSPVLGLAWTGGERPPLDFFVESDRETLVDLVEDALGDVYAVGRDVFQTATVESMPFAPHHLMTTMTVFLQAMQIRDDLALRVGGEVA